MRCNQGSNKIADGSWKDSEGFRGLVVDGCCRDSHVMYASIRQTIRETLRDPSEIQQPFVFEFCRRFGGGGEWRPPMSSFLAVLALNYFGNRERQHFTFATPPGLEERRSHVWATNDGLNVFMPSFTNIQNNTVSGWKTRIKQMSADKQTKKHSKERVSRFRRPSPS